MWYYFIMKNEKLLQKIINNSRNVKFDDFKKFLGIFGFQYSHNSGSHQIFYHKGLNGFMNIQPDKNGNAKSYQIKQFIKFLEEKDVI